MRIEWYYLKMYFPPKLWGSFTKNQKVFNVAKVWKYDEERVFSRKKGSHLFKLHLYQIGKAQNMLVVTAVLFSFKSNKSRPLIKAAGKKIARIQLFKFNIEDGRIQPIYSVFPNFRLKNIMNFVLIAFFLGVIFGDYLRLQKIVFLHLGTNSACLVATLTHFGKVNFILIKSCPHTRLIFGRVQTKWNSMVFHRFDNQYFFSGGGGLPDAVKSEGLWPLASHFT